MVSYLIYHPRRSLSVFGDLKVYHDPFGGNQDPYIWNTQFLHTYCHITQIQLSSLMPKDLIFWVSGDRFPQFSHLYCDLVFEVQDICKWRERNRINRHDPIVDSLAAFTDHYQWAERGQHPFRRRRRYTLKAHPERSFQPQDAERALLDIIPFLLGEHLAIEILRQELRTNPSSTRSKPFRIDCIAPNLYVWLEQQATFKLKGGFLQKIRQEHPNLSSNLPLVQLKDCGKTCSPRNKQGKC